MPTITLNKSVLENLVGKKLSLEQLKDRISMLGTDLEKIEGNEIVVEIFPNRPDMLSEQGFARALSSFIGAKTGIRKYEPKKSGLKVVVERSVEDIRPFTACAIVKNLKLDEEKIREIIQIQEKLHVTYGRNRKKCALGVYPLEKITFPVVYKADDPAKIKFQPLDSSKIMNAAQILSDHKAGKEYGHLLLGLAKYPFFIDAKNEILSMPPIINSENTGKVTSKTKELFVECSGFDFDTVSICLNIIVTALAEMSGDVYSIDVEYGGKIKTTPDLTPRTMKLDLNHVNTKLGLKLSETEVGKLLEKMGYGYEKGWILIPAYRADVLHPVDLIEDIAIAYGYENFVPEIPRVATMGQEDALEAFMGKVRDILIGLEMLEVKNYHLMTNEDLNQKMDKNEKIIHLKNAVGEQTCLRNRILASLLKNLGENQHQEYPQNIFEIGRTFNLGKNAVIETEHLAIALCHEKADFTEIKQQGDYLLRSTGMEMKVKETHRPSFMEGRVGEIIVKNKKIGILGEIHPQVLSNWKLTMPVVALELDINALKELVA